VLDPRHVRQRWPATLPAPAHPSATSRPDPLAALVRDSRPWLLQPGPLSAPAARMLRGLLGVFGFEAVALLAVLGGSVPDVRVISDVATLGGNPVLQLALAATGVLGLLGAAVATRDFTTANGPELAVVLIALVAGALSLLGVAAIALAALLAGRFLLAIVDRI
jgi:hypothetical protein